MAVTEEGIVQLSWGGLSFTAGDTAAFAQALAAAPHPVQVVTANPEMILLCRRHEGFRRAFTGAHFRTVDGVGLAWVLSRLHHWPVPLLTGVDVTHHLFDAWKDKPLFLLGSTEANVASAAAALQKRGVTLAGWHHGYFTDEEGVVIARKVADSGAYWVLVGMGAPRQEVFIAEHLAAMGVHLAMGVGGVIDLLAGQTRRAPLSWRRLKLEWLHRLVSDPKRWRRYLRLFTFIPLALRGVYLKHPPFGPSVPP